MPLPASVASSQEGIGPISLVPKVSNASISLWGRFNPVLLTPAWFALHNLLPRRVAKDAFVEMGHESLMFHADWLRLTAERGQLWFETRQAPFIRVCDLVIRVVREQLCGTDVMVTAFSIIRGARFEIGSPEQRHRIARRMTPLSNLGAWSEALGDTVDTEGTTSLGTTQPASRDRYGETVTATVLIAGAGANHLSIVVDDHYLPEPGKGPSEDMCRELMTRLGKYFDSSVRRSDGIIDAVVSKARGA